MRFHDVENFLVSWVSEPGGDWVFGEILELLLVSDLAIILSYGH